MQRRCEHDSKRDLPEILRQNLGKTDVIAGAGRIVAIANAVVEHFVGEALFLAESMVVQARKTEMEQGDLLLKGNLSAAVDPRTSKALCAEANGVRTVAMAKAILAAAKVEELSERVADDVMLKRSHAMENSSAEANACRLAMSPVVAEAKQHAMAAASKLHLSPTVFMSSPSPGAGIPGGAPPNAMSLEASLQMDF